VKANFITKAWLEGHQSNGGKVEFIKSGQLVKILFVSSKFGLMWSLAPHTRTKLENIHERIEFSNLKFICLF
jgi:hypothetical protein